MDGVSYQTIGELAGNWISHLIKGGGEYTQRLLSLFESEEKKTKGNSQKIITQGREKWGCASAKEKARIASLILSKSRDLPVEDQAILLAIAEHESGFNPRAKNPNSSAYGVFQFIDKTWSCVGGLVGNRSNVEAQVSLGIALYKENLRYLDKRGLSDLQGEKRAVEMYVLHHDGCSGYDYGGRKIAEKYVLARYNNYLKILNELI